VSRHDEAIVAGPLLKAEFIWISIHFNWEQGSQQRKSHLIHFNRSAALQTKYRDRKRGRQLRIACPSFLQLAAREVGDQLRCGGVEPDHVQHAGVFWDSDNCDKFLWSEFKKALNGN
jgi:hypothetical protein